MQPQSRILVTGANGFVGRHVVDELLRHGHALTVASRQTIQLPNTLHHPIQDLGKEQDWSKALNHVNAVIHCAARVHVMHDNVSDPLAEFRRINVLATLNLARQAQIAGVKHFIYLSSIKVNGEYTKSGYPFREIDQPNPQDPYGLSKLEAEQNLIALCKSARMNLTIIRPPLIYGPGVAANFQQMLRWVKKGVPIPLGNISNKRSLIFIGNLTNFISECVLNPAAYGQTFLISDDQDVSTTELLKKCANALSCPARLIPVSKSLLLLAATILGKRAIAQRLCESLEVDISKAKTIMEWKPPYTLQQGLQQTTLTFR